MKIGIMISMGVWKREFFWGKAEAKYALAELSGTVLTVGIALFVRV